MDCQREMQARMIGVIHRDPFGEGHLAAVLRWLRPTLVTLEVSPYGAAFRRQNGERLLCRLEELLPPGAGKHAEIVFVRELLRLPFELRAAEDYACETSAAVELVGDSDESRELLASVETELLTPENLRTLAAQPDYDVAASIRAQYERHRRWRRDEPVPSALLGWPADRVAQVEAREEQLEHRIRDAIRRHQPVCWVHVGGATHLVRARGLRLLWDRFAAEGVTRLLLDEALIPRC